MQYFDEELTEVSVEYTIDTCRPVLSLLANGYEGKTKIAQVSYIATPEWGSRSENGIDITYGVNYTLEVSYYYKTVGLNTGYKVSSSRSTVNYGSDGTTLDYHFFELINAGYNVDNMNTYHAEHPDYIKYTNNAVVYAPSTFFYAVKGSGSLAGSGVNYELHLKRGNSRWKTEKTLHVD